VAGLVVKRAELGDDLGMVEKMKQDWREFTESKPGERFQDRYRRRQEEEQGRMATRIFLIVLGAIIAVGSLVTAPLPGPGWATVFLGLMILASELLSAARLLDWLEVRLREPGQGRRRHGGRDPRRRRAVHGLLATVLAAKGARRRLYLCASRSRTVTVSW
jgi:uncharacterized protein (TIGR02611 family)